jgi:mannose-6-phosphate isomerase-like protein (cupin superfamily)
MSVNVVNRDQLPSSAFSHELVGDDHGGVGVSLILTDAGPGQGPSLHRHPYEEIHVVQEGEALFVAGDEQRIARAGDIVVVPAGTAHRFENSGDGRFREIGIHVSSRFVTEWLDG